MSKLEKIYSRYPTIFLTIPLFFSFLYYLSFYISFYLLRGSQASFFYSRTPRLSLFLTPFCFIILILRRPYVSLLPTPFCFIILILGGPLSHKTDALTRIYLGFPLSDVIFPPNTCLSFFFFNSPRYSTFFYELHLVISKLIIKVIWYIF